MDILKNFPTSQELLQSYSHFDVLNVNGHVHSPFSFSAFDSIQQMFELSEKENIKVLGLNDFFVTDGYAEFYNAAVNARIFPLFNIEFLGLMKNEQAKGIRINDPNNPGRIYFSGKGLNYPVSITNALKSKLDKVIEETQNQVRAMVVKANDWFVKNGVNISLDFSEMKALYARELVRERHLAKAIREKVFSIAADDDRKKLLFQKIYGGKESKCNMNDIPGLENEIRGNLLKSGGHAFVEETPAAFMPLEDIINIIVTSGGIPCYPLLLDDKAGNYTEFEKDFEVLLQNLQKYQVGCIELIPGRNDIQHLAKLVDFFESKDFVIFFGTEHNAPEMIPISVDTRGNIPLNAHLQKTSYEGACVIAAHQYLKSKDMDGFLFPCGTPKLKEKKQFIQLGNAVINKFVNI